MTGIGKLVVPVRKNLFKWFEWDKDEINKKIIAKQEHYYNIQPSKSVIRDYLMGHTPEKLINQFTHVCRFDWYDEDAIAGDVDEIEKNDMVTLLLNVYVERMAYTNEILLKKMELRATRAAAKKRLSKNKGKITKRTKVAEKPKAKKIPKTSTSKTKKTNKSNNTNTNISSSSTVNPPVTASSASNPGSVPPSNSTLTPNNNITNPTNNNSINNNIPPPITNPTGSNPTVPPLTSNLGNNNNNIPSLPLFNIPNIIDFNPSLLPLAPINNNNTSNNNNSNLIPTPPNTNLLTNPPSNTNNNIITANNPNSNTNNNVLNNNIGILNNTNTSNNTNTVSNNAINANLNKTGTVNTQNNQNNSTIVDLTTLTGKSDSDTDLDNILNKGNGGLPNYIPPNMNFNSNIAPNISLFNNNYDDTASIIDLSDSDDASDSDINSSDEDLKKKFVSKSFFKKQITNTVNSSIATALQPILKELKAIRSNRPPKRPRNVMQQPIINPNQGITNAKHTNNIIPPLGNNNNNNNVTNNQNNNNNNQFIHPNQSLIYNSNTNNTQLNKLNHAQKLSLFEQLSKDLGMPPNKKLKSNNYKNINTPINYGISTPSFNNLSIPENTVTFYLYFF